MKSFNSFAGSSPINSNYSPKTNSPKFMFPSSTQSRGHNIEHLKANLEKELCEKMPSIDITKAEQQQIIQEVEQENNNSKVSLLLSQVSVPSFQKPEYDAKRLFNLQSKITQNILELRQQKISLMQELSRTIDIKNLHEHYLNQIVKEKDEQDSAYGSRLEKSKNLRANNQEQEIVPIHISAQILKRNEDLHLRLKQLQIKEEIFGSSLKQSESQSQNVQLMQEIMRFKQLNTKLKAQIAQKLKVNSSSSNSQSRFVTFLPQDRQKHLKNSNIQAELLQLKQKYTKMVTLLKQPVFKLTQSQNSFIEQLRRENQELINQAQQLLKKKQGSKLAQLREKLQLNEHEKSLFLTQLQKFKHIMREVKQQNQILKRQLNR